MTSRHSTTSRIRPPVYPAPGGGAPTSSHPAMLELGRILGRLMAEEDLDDMLPCDGLDSSLPTGQP